MKTKVAIVIPNWNGQEYIAEALASLEQQSSQAHIIVVDNGSVDDSVNIIKTNFKDVEMLEFSDNAGFAGGVNRGLSKALKDGYEYIALFNNDATADKHWLEKLVGAMRAGEDIGITTCMFLRDDQKHIDSTGELYSTRGLPISRGRNKEDTGQYDKNEEVFGATGGASLYRTVMLKKIGLFDEDFFAYFEDVDISFRAQLAGWKVRYEPAARAYHYVGGTSSKLGTFARFHGAKNFWLLYHKNMPGVLYFKYLPLFLLQFCRMAASSILRGHFWTFLKGSLVAIAQTPSTLKKRRQIQRSRTVSTQYIDSILWHGRPPRPPKI